MRHQMPRLSKYVDDLTFVENKAHDNEGILRDDLDS